MKERLFRKFNSKPVTPRRIADQIREITTFDENAVDRYLPTENDILDKEKGGIKSIV